MKGRRLARRLVPVMALLVAVVFLGRRFLPAGGTDDGWSVDDFDSVARVAPAEASDHVGERAVVCGRVVEGTYLSDVRGAPTYLNFEAPYPDQPFTALIWGRDRDAFPTPPERAYRDARICVGGTIRTYEGDPRIEVRSPDQLRAATGDPTRRRSRPEQRR